MVRVGGRSRGCRLCRQRRIKCDELLPSCTQCTNTGRICPGPVSGIIISDMTLAASRPTKARRATPGKSGGAVNKTSKGKKSSSAHEETLSTLDLEGLTESGDPALEIVGEDYLEGESQTYLPAHQVNKDVVPVERNQYKLPSIQSFGLELDPFRTLPVGTYFSVPKLIHHCTKSMVDSLVNLGSGDPMKDAWNSIILSDQLLLQCSLYTAAVHMSAIYGIDNLSNVDVVTHRTWTLALLNQRLMDPALAINDVTLTSVLGFLAQVIVNGNVQETTLHLDGIQRMLDYDPSFIPSDNVREILFWTDLIGSGLCHTPLRSFATRPKVYLLCHPLVLNPRSTVGVLCRGFQKILSRHGVFNSITHILHDLRCLTTVAHYSDYRAHLELPLYNELCRGMSRSLTRLPSMEGFAAFESCRLAVMVFTEVVLLDDRSNAALLAAGIKTTLQDLDISEIMYDTPELTFWVLFMGSVAATGTELEPWYKSSFEMALVTLKLDHFEMVRRVLIEFLWLEGVLNEYLKRIWIEVQVKMAT